MTATTICFLLEEESAKVMLQAILPRLVSADISAELSTLTHKQYQKISGSRAIAPHLSLEEGHNRSHSFNVLVGGIKALLN